MERGERGRGRFTIHRAEVQPGGIRKGGWGGLEEGQAITLFHEHQMWGEGPRQETIVTAARTCTTAKASAPRVVIRGYARAVANLRAAELPRAILLSRSLWGHVFDLCHVGCTWFVYARALDSAGQMRSSTCLSPPFASGSERHTSCCRRASCRPLEVRRARSKGLARAVATERSRMCGMELFLDVQAWVRGCVGAPRKLSQLAHESKHVSFPIVPDTK